MGLMFNILAILNNVGCVLTLTDLHFVPQECVQEELVGATRREERKIQGALDRHALVGIWDAPDFNI